ncbi:MAG: hypothetical protein EPN46_07790 [Candidimonas sp.]|nr:MAG: hypothetical protein EPN77_11745 [Candidimonas sp.]TAM24140.1 MAG: hypothetical protein EPN62_07865 [Candidimonas sp.]TAM76870.1 MAG: hypothetical protein EPN46_07790 [Candidimonas sp.]
MKMTKISAAVAVSFGLLLSGAAFAADSAMPTMNWFGGPTYNGAPALPVTAALVKAGGGAQHFSFSTALVSMLGEKTVNAEVAKLTKQYGKQKVTDFVNGMTFDVNAGLKRATEAGVKLPAAPADLKGAKLAETLVTAGTTSDGTFWSGYLFDKALSHPIHNQVMADVDVKFGHASDENTHRILNQAMYDVAQALGHKSVKLASLH